MRKRCKVFLEEEGCAERGIECEFFFVNVRAKIGLLSSDV